MNRHLNIVTDTETDRQDSRANNSSARERSFGWGSKNWWKTIKTIKFKL